MELGSRRAKTLLLLSTMNRIFSKKQQHLVVWTRKKTSIEQIPDKPMSQVTQVSFNLTKKEKESEPIGESLTDKMNELFLQEKGFKEYGKKKKKETRNCFFFFSVSLFLFCSFL